MFDSPNLKYQVEFVVEFEKVNCCPVLDLQWHHREGSINKHLNCYNSSILNLELNWFKNVVFLLDPGQNSIGNFVNCQTGTTSDKYLCTVKVHGQNYELKNRYLQLGYTCEDYGKTLQNMTIKADIILDSNTTTCLPMEGSKSFLDCNQLYNYISFPNVFGHYTQADAAQNLDLLKTIILNQKRACHKYLSYILCQAFFPQCPTIQNTNASKVQIGNRYEVDYMVVICRETCFELREACAEALYPAIEVVNCN